MIEELLSQQITGGRDMNKYFCQFPNPETIILIAMIKDNTELGSKYLNIKSC